MFSICILRIEDKCCECSLDSILEYTPADIRAYDSQEETQYISSLTKGYCAKPLREDWNWYIDCYRYHHIPSHYHGKYCLLYNKSLSNETFESDNEAISFIDLNKKPGVLIHVGPRNRRARCFMQQESCGGRGISILCINGVWNKGKVQLHQF